MKDKDDKLVPVAGINHHQKYNDFPGAARSFGGAWPYPEDVPSTHARKHGTPRRWTLRGFLALAVFAILAFWMGVAMAIGQERVIVDGMGGGSFRWGYDQAEGYWQRGQPVELRGRYVSAGTFLLWSVEQLPGSCIHPDAIFAFHEPQRLFLASLAGCAPYGLDHPDRAAAIEHVTRPYNAGLTRWFMAEVVGDTPSCGFTTLIGADLARFGYPICEEGEE